MLGHWRDADTGRGHQVWAFVLTLPFSKQPFVFPTTRMDQTAWTGAHVAAFEFFGAVPRRITSDNLKTGVISPDLYDPKLNRAYAELAEHYGTLLDPARGNKPKDKPHVERMVQYVRGSFWAGRSFTSMAQMRAETERWCREVAGARKPRALAGQSPWDVLASVERPAMVPLPPRRLEPAEWRTATVGSDCHASVRGVLYSVPYQLVGTRLDVRLGATTVEFHLDGAIAKVHPRIAKGRQTDLSDYPPAAAGFFTRDAAWCREHASLIGSAAAALVEGLLEEPAVHRIRGPSGLRRGPVRGQGRLGRCPGGPCRRPVPVELGLFGPACRGAGHDDLPLPVLLAVCPMRGLTGCTPRTAPLSPRPWTPRMTSGRPRASSPRSCAGSSGGPAEAPQESLTASHFSQKEY